MSGSEAIAALVASQAPVVTPPKHEMEVVELELQEMGFDKEAASDVTENIELSPSSLLDDSRINLVEKNKWKVLSGAEKLAPLIDSDDDSQVSDLNSADEEKLRVISGGFGFRIWMYWKRKIDSWDAYLFPSDIPREVQLWRWENIAIPCCYLLVGTFQGLSSAVLNMYPLEIGATEAQQTTIKVLRGLPASFKILFGFISDGFPILGYRRKIYMAAGWILASFSMLLLAVIGSPSIEALSLFVFLSSLGFWFADVIGDSLVAEKAKMEPEEHRGMLQSTCYACRFFMLMISVTLSTLLYELVSPSFIFGTLAVLPILVALPTIYWLKEERYQIVNPIKQQCSEIWSAVCSRSVWQPMGFVYCYNLLQVGNAAWNQFLYTGLKFTTWQLNSFLIEAHTLTFLGIIVYKKYLRHWSWRFIYLISTLLNALFSALQFVLIFQLNKRIGVSNYVFALGDDVFAEFISGIQFLPTTIMMVHLCPAGSEGAAYAMFTTVSNAALNLAGTISTWFLRIWDVSVERFTEEPMDVSGMWRLSLLTTCLQTSALFLIPLLPSNKTELYGLDFRRISRIGGAVFIFVLSASLLWSIITAVLNTLD